MILAEQKRRIEAATAQLIARRLVAGESAAQIRSEAARVAADAIAQVMGDQWEQETVMAEINRGIKKAFTGEELLRGQRGRSGGPI
jgi:hypothetical protein